MNCECIYYNRNASEEDLLALAREVHRRGLSVEIYPCALSRMTERTECLKEYMGGKSLNIPKDSKVLFVGGKYAYMVDIKVNDKTFRPWFPVDYEIHFEDIRLFTEGGVY